MGNENAEEGKRGFDRASGAERFGHPSGPNGSRRIGDIERGDIERGDIERGDIERGDIERCQAERVARVVDAALVELG
ncbi:MAG: hypothetical protein ACE361_03725 [Aureliella sp.]